ncbi:MAG: methyltransferase domain-containing protein [Bacteroidetes bacterium]|nr:MAG: methyltransferase domain-containing protein [Bacteroidota bacterium]
MPTLYDTVPYPTLPSPYTHPDTPATLGRLHGMPVAPVERCRVLEVGCGDGGNLIPMAHDLPGSTFVGIDLAERPIAHGRDRAAALGLHNLTLMALDLRQTPADLGAFDYIIAHGVYAWVPADVREGLLALIRRHLAPHGLALVSYALYPGAYLFRMLREMMLFHVRGIEDPLHRAAQARALLHLLHDAQAEDTAYARVIAEKLKRFSTVPDEYLTHDILNEHYAPCTFLDFVEHARAHDLRYLADADYFSMHPGGLPGAVRTPLQALEETPLLLEQYLDFMRGRSFRRSLLCHPEAAVQTPHPAAMDALYFAAPVEATPVGVGTPPEAVATLRGLRGHSIQTGHALTQAVARYLGDQWPRRVPFGELLDVARPHHDDAGTSADALLRVLLLGLYRDGFLEAHTCAPPLTLTPGDRPEASRVARHAAEASAVVPNLHHQPVTLDEDEWDLLPYLDGSRDRAALEAATGFTPDEQDALLARLARQALLLA